MSSKVLKILEIVAELVGGAACLLELFASRKITDTQIDEAVQKAIAEKN